MNTQYKTYGKMDKTLKTVTQSFTLSGAQYKDIKYI